MWKYILFGFFVIGNLGAQAQNQPKIKVLATINIIADMANEVAGGLLDVESLLPAGTDPHSYEPTPSDAVKVSQAQVILKNGLSLEGWLDKLIASAATKATVCTVTQGIEPITSAEHANSFDPHTWMNLRLAERYIQNIDSLFSTLLPQSAHIFHRNAEAYRKAIQAVDLEVRQAVLRIEESKRIIITSHDAFRYFAREYGFEVASILGTSTDADINIKDVNHLIMLVKTHQIPGIFVEMALNPKVLQQLAKDLNVKIGGSLYTDSFGPPGSEASSYLDMMRYNARVITSTLASSGSHTQASLNHSQFYWVGAFFLVFGLLLFWIQRHVYPNFQNEANWENYTLQVSNLSVILGRKIVLSNVYLKLHPGRLYGIIGSNGSGKSTLLKTILGLYKPLSGSVLLHGKPLVRFARNIAYLPQKEEFDMNFPVTVEDVVKLGFFPGQSGLGKLTVLQERQCEAVLEKLEMLPLRNRPIAQLSGGQFQRTLLARALCQNAQIIFLDEPFVGVDFATEETLIHILKELTKEGKMIVMVHHDLTKVKAYFDHVILVNQRIVAEGPTEEVFTEENLNLTFSGKTTLLQKALQLIKPHLI